MISLYQQKIACFGVDLLDKFRTFEDSLKSSENLRFM